MGGSLQRRHAGSNRTEQQPSSLSLYTWSKSQRTTCLEIESRRLNRHMAAVRKHMDCAGRRRRLELSPSVLFPMRWCDLIDSSDRLSTTYPDPIFLLFFFFFMSHAHSITRDHPCTCTSIPIYIAAHVPWTCSSLLTPSSDHYLIPHSLRFVGVHAPDLQHHWSRLLRHRARVLGSLLVYPCYRP